MFYEVSRYNMYHSGGMVSIPLGVVFSRFLPVRDSAAEHYIQLGTDMFGTAGQILTRRRCCPPWRTALPETATWRFHPRRQTTPSWEFATDHSRIRVSARPIRFHSLPPFDARPRHDQIVVVPRSSSGAIRHQMAPAKEPAEVSGGGGNFFRVEWALPGLWGWPHL
jgi:hypothetical protein